MRFALRSLVMVGGVLLCAVAIGFVLFAVRVSRADATTTEIADGIVVLTGGAARIAEGAKLLADGRGRRMLISGVNRQTTKKDVLKITRLPEKNFDCCVDLGYRALDTIGNADETRDWATARSFSSLIIVTSNYHMPRSIAELSLALPSTRLIPHPVVAKSFPKTAWWLYPRTARMLLSEYLKYLPAAARLTLAQLVHGGNGNHIAETPPARRPAS